MNSDLTAPRQEYLFRTPVCIRGLLRDQRDLPLAYLLFNVCVLTVPAAVFVLWANSQWLGFLYWLVNLLVFEERFLLGLHFFTHRKVFKSDMLNNVLTIVLPPLFGIPWGLYRIHHVLMHHAENNKDGMDLSSTERYQRDSVLHFLHYWCRFLFGIWVELPYNCFRRNRFEAARHAVFWILTYWAVILALFAWRPTGVFWVLMWPVVPASFVLMLGNWCQHMFITPGESRSNYHLTYNVINTPANQRTFNDGYHAEHHIYGAKHWSELPAAFMDRLEKYKEEDAVVFQGTDFMSVGIMVFLERYDKLATLLYPVSVVRNSIETEAFLRARLRPI